MLGRVPAAELLEETALFIVTSSLAAVELFSRHDMSTKALLCVEIFWSHSISAIAFRDFVGFGSSANLLLDVIKSAYRRFPEKH